MASVDCGFRSAQCSPHLDWRKVIKEEYPRHVLPLLYVSSLEVLCHRVLIAIYGLVSYITVYGWHYLDKGSTYFCSHCHAWTLLFHRTTSKASKPLRRIHGIATCRRPFVTGTANVCRQRRSVDSIQQINSNLASAQAYAKGSRTCRLRTRGATHEGVIGKP